MKLSRYAVKNSMRALRMEISSVHGISKHDQCRMFAEWLARNVRPASKDEMMRAELSWLDDLNKNLSTPPDQFAPWFHPLLPADASTPFDFPEIYVWRVGYRQPRKIRPENIGPGNFEKTYWRPVFSDDPDMSRLN